MPVTEKSSPTETVTNGWQTFPLHPCQRTTLKRKPRLSTSRSDSLEIFQNNQKKSNMPDTNPPREVDFTEIREVEFTSDALLANIIVLGERKKQLRAFPPSRDRVFREGELALAAAAYAIPPDGDGVVDRKDDVWPWDPMAFRPEGRIEELAKAGALILSEIERLIAEARDTPE